jgi:hypothetical protein
VRKAKAPEPTLRKLPVLGAKRRTRQSHFDSAAPHQGQNWISRNEDPPPWMKRP